MRNFAYYFLVCIFFYLIIKIIYFGNYYSLSWGEIFTFSIVLKPINIIVISVYNSYIVYLLFYILNTKYPRLCSIINDTFLFSSIFLLSDLYSLFYSIILDDPSIYFEPQCSLYNYFNRSQYGPIFSYTLRLCNVFELANVLLYNIYLISYSVKFKFLVYYNLVSLALLILWGLFISFFELLNV